MHKLNTSGRLGFINKKLSLIISTSYHDKRLKQPIYYNEDVFYWNESGRYCRYLYSNTFGVYVCFPGEKLPYSIDIASEEEYGETEINLFSTERITQTEINMILTVSPNFRYTLEKLRIAKEEEAQTDLYLYTVWDIYTLWLKNPAIEFLVEGGFFRLLKTKSIITATGKKAKKICKVLKEVPADKYGYYNLFGEVRSFFRSSLKVSDIRLYEKVKDWEEVFNYNDWSSRFGCYSYQDYLYLKDKGQSVLYQYKDYLSLVIVAGHNNKDPYWRWPKNFDEAHQKVLAEVGNIRVLKEAKKMEEIQKAYYEVCKHFLPYNSNFFGYDCYVEVDLKKWQSHASVLHQCICAAGYYKQVAKKEKIIVFIAKENLPIATAEIFPSGKVGQFYTDEDKLDYLPSEEVKAVLNAYLAQCDVQKVFAQMKKEKTRAGA